jgi:hypothetical protein
VTLFRITAPHFCCGVIVNARGFIVKAAPILKWATQKHVNQLREYGIKRNWLVEAV